MRQDPKTTSPRTARTDRPRPQAPTRRDHILDAWRVFERDTKIPPSRYVKIGNGLILFCSTRTRSALRACVSRRAFFWCPFSGGLAIRQLGAMFRGNRS